MDAPTYSLTLHHLAPDAREASARMADLELPRVGADKLRSLLNELAAVAVRHRTDGSVSPEIRIRIERTELLVRARDGALHLVSWDKSFGGQNLTVAEIMAQLERAASAPGVASAAPASAAGRASGVRAGKSGRGKIVLLIAAVVAVNAFTAWNLLKPETDGFLPAHKSLPTEETRELLTRAAGEYETGSRQGDRRLIIQPDGSLILSTYGPSRTIVEQINRSAKGARYEGQPALVTSDPAMLEIRDRDTVVLYGNVFKRRSS